MKTIPMIPNANYTHPGLCENCKIIHINALHNDDDVKKVRNVCFVNISCPNHQNRSSCTMELLTAY